MSQVLLSLWNNRSYYCSSRSLCHPRYDHYGQKPLCLCSISSYGLRSFMDRQCQMNADRNPCLNGGICFIKHQHSSLIDAFICQCPKSHFGSKCQYHSGSIEINYDSQNQSANRFHEQMRATVIQLFDFSGYEELILKKQVLYKNYLPSHSIIVYQSINDSFSSVVYEFKCSHIVDFDFSAWYSELLSSYIWYFSTAQWNTSKYALYIDLRELFNTKILW